MATIGQLITFCDFVRIHDVEIPRIQRDYTYGSGTEKTEEVLCKLLSDIYNAPLKSSSLISYMVVRITATTSNLLMGSNG